MKEARPGLELAEDLEFQHRSWRLERVGWVAIASVLAVALAGGLGQGPLSYTQAGRPGEPFWIEFERFPHYQTDMAVVAHVAASAARGREIRIAFDQAYVRDHQFIRIEPRPTREVPGERAITYVFEPPAEGQGALITFFVRPDGYGPKVATVSLAGGPSHRLSTFVWP